MSLLATTQYQFLMHLIFYFFFFQISSLCHGSILMGHFFILCLLHFEQCASHSGVQLKQVAYAGPGRHKGIFYYKIVYVIIVGIPKFRPKIMGHFFVPEH